MVTLLPAARTRGADRAGPAPLAHVPAPPGIRVRALLWRGRFVVAAVCLGAAAGVVVHAWRPPPPPTVPVVVLAHDIPAGTALAAGDLTVVDVPPHAAPDGTFADPTDLEGRTAAVDLPARLPVTPALLADAGLVGPAGTVVVAVRLDDPAVAAMLTPGLHLDLVAARLEGGPGQTVAQRALVRPSAQVGDAGEGLLAATTGDGTVPVLVAVSPQEAVRIAEASVSSRLVAVVVP